MIRIDFIFSYWIFAWYLLYMIQIINFNPKFALICGLIENIIIILLMIYFKTKYKLIILFLIMCFIMKIIPLYTLSATNIQILDIKITIKIFCYYLIWMIANNKTSNDFIKNTYDLIIFNKNTLPGMTLLDKFKFLI